MHYSAFGASLANFGIREIALTYPKSDMINFAQMPDPQPGSAQGGIEVQNFVQALPDANEFSDAIIPVTNRTIYENMLAHKSQATLKDVNSVIVDMVLTITASAFDRSCSSAKFSAAKLNMNALCYPHTNFMTPYLF
jgi:hypothetical protein